MNHSGDAAEQIVRMSLEGVEVAAKITGNAAKEIALLLMAAMKSPDKGGSSLKLRGKERMSSMLKSGKALEIYSVRESDLKKFYQGAKQYGIVYCVLRNSKADKDGLCDILVKAEDAPKISRVAERFKFATVDKAKIESEIVAAKTEKAAGEKATDTDGTPTHGDAEQPDAEQPDAPDVNDTDKLVDDLLGTPEGKPAPEKTEAEKTDAAKPTPEKEPTESRPLADAPPKSSPSEITSESRSKYGKGTFRPSVKAELREITAAHKAKETKEAEPPARDDKAATDKPKTTPTATTHKQPQSGKKSKKPKERS